MSKLVPTRRAVLAATAGFAVAARADPTVTWRTLARGLEHAQAQIPASIGDRQLHAVRIDPLLHRFALLTSAATNTAPRTAQQWARDHGLIAATNAGMFRASRLPVGFAKADRRIIQPTLTADRSVIVFDTAHARLLDLACDTFKADAHDNALQSVRMMSCDGRNVWRREARMWSIACLAQDKSGRVLFVHARSPLSVHDFADTLKALPLNLARIMYLEGGPEATLYASTGDKTIDRFGSYETGFNENDENAAAWPLPNVLGAIPR